MNLNKYLISLFKRDITQELIISGLGCFFFYIFFGFLPDKAWDPVYRTTILMIMGISFFLCFLFLNQTNTRYNFFKVNYKRNIILFSIFIFSIWCFLFYQTSFGFLGVVSDNWYRSAYVTRMAHSGYPQDYAYKNRSAFYSPFYYYCLALIAIIFNIQPYRMIKIGFLLSFYILPIIVFEFWKKIYKENISFIIAVVSMIILGDIYSIDKMISTMLFIPYFVYYFENHPQREFKLKNYIIGGVIGAMIFTTNYLFFIAIPIYYIIILIQNKKKFMENFRHILYLSFFLLMFSCWFWLPLLIDILFIGFESHQNRYFNIAAVTFPLLTYFNLAGFFFFYTIGVIFIIKNYSSRLDMRIFGNLLISINFIFIIGFIGILIGFPIMHIRFLPLSLYMLVIAACIFYVKFISFLDNSDLLKRYNVKMNLKQLEVYLLIAFTFFQYTTYAYSITTTPEYEGTLEEARPVDLIEIFEELDYEDKVFLTTKYRVAAFIPVYCFLLPIPYYSHPSALYNERVKFLVELSECESSKEFHKKVVENEFEPIDYFFLDSEKNDTVLRFDVAVETFPVGREYYEIEFDRSLFLDPWYFKEKIIDGKIIYKTKY